MWLENQAGEGEMGLLGDGSWLLRKGMVAARGHEKARRAWNRAGESRDCLSGELACISGY